VDVTISFKGASDQDRLIAAVILRRLFQAEDVHVEGGKVMLSHCRSFLNDYGPTEADEEFDEEDDDDGPGDPAALDDELEPEDDDLDDEDDE